ncbi:benzodiazapine receptor [Ilyonectria robusta]
MARALRRIRYAPHFCATSHAPRATPGSSIAHASIGCDDAGYSPHPNPNEGGNSQTCHLLCSLTGTTPIKLDRRLAHDRFKSGIVWHQATLLAELGLSRTWRLGIEAMSHNIPEQILALNTYITSLSPNCELSFPFILSSSSYTLYLCPSSPVQMTTFIPALTLPSAVFLNPAVSVLLPIGLGTAVGLSARR